MFCKIARRNLCLPARRDKDGIKRSTHSEKFSAEEGALLGGPRRARIELDLAAKRNMAAAVAESMGALQLIPPKLWKREQKNAT
jgi:hypothetical protein